MRFGKLTMTAVSAAIAIGLAACSKEAEHSDAPPAAPESVAAAVADYGALLASDARFEGDAARDASRKPAETLAFTQIAPGDNVFEVEAGGGYFTELYSRLVGPEGSVVMQNFQGFMDYAKDEIAARLANDRLPNVRLSVTKHDALDAPDASMDVATWVQGPHDLWFKPEPDAELDDPAGAFAEIYRVLKPGAPFTVIDHVAAPGSPATSGDELHRIDKQIVIDLATGAGFVLEEEANFLANPDDDHTLVAFAPPVQGKTDQFVLRFRKPE